MKRILGVKRAMHKLSMKVVADYYGGVTNQSVLRYIEGDRVYLTEEEKSDAWAIKQNMEDKVYVDGFK